MDDMLRQRGPLKRCTHETPAHEIYAGHTGLSSEGGLGGWEKGSIDRHHQSVIMNTGAEGAEFFFEH